MRDRAVFTGGTMDDTPTVEQALADLLALNDQCAVSLSGLMPTCDPTRCDQDPDHRPEKCLWCRARRAVASRRKVCSELGEPAMTSKSLIQRAITDLAQAEQAYSAGTADSPSLYLAAQAARQLLMQALTMLPAQDRRFEAATRVAGHLAPLTDYVDSGGNRRLWSHKRIAETARQIADALIAELAKEQR